ncbi:MAG: antibiotic biosynthesis monooxygenase [Chthoniobacterales bacterium]
MITRLWRGWTTRENAQPYESLLRTEILPAIAKRCLKDYHGARLFRRDVAEGVEFLTILTFDSLEAVRVFAGEDAELAHVPEKARALLRRFDERAQHYSEVPLK